jgi:DNA-binding NarL/FixJ family response regulator
MIKLELSQPPAPRNQPTMAEALTERQVEIARALAHGQSTRQIANPSDGSEKPGFLR